MRKSKKTLAILAIIAMVLMMIPVQAFADTTSATNRLAGDTRVDTAIAIANNGWANGASTVVVVPSNDENLVDALAVAPLAKQLNAPVLITDKAGLDAKVAAEIATLKATTVYAVGALSDATVAQLKALSGVTVNQIKGADRFETAAQIAAKLTNPAGTFVVAYNGLADALSAASFAAANGYAILVADTNGSLPASEKIVGSKTYTVGGQVAAISGATSFAGADRYATNDAVLKGLTYKYDKVYVANGETLVDALAGSVLAAMTNSPIVLANTTGATAAAGVDANLTSSSQVIAFGGAGVVPDAVLGSVTYTAPATLAVTSVSAINLNQVKVVFTQQVDKASATIVSNYRFNGTDLVVGTDTAVLQSDKKTVLVTMDSAQAQYGTGIFEVKKNVIYTTDYLSAVPAFSQSLTFSDTTIPTVSSVSATGNKEVDVVFSEPVKIQAGTPDGSWKIDGHSIYNFGYTSSNISDQTKVNKYTNEIDLSFGVALSVGNHTLTVPAGASGSAVLVDAAGFYLADNTVNFSVDSITTAPTVSATGSNNGTVYVTYSAQMTDSGSGNALDFTKYTINGTAATAASFKSNTGSKVVKLSFAAVDKGANILVINHNLQDVYGNKLDPNNDIRVSFTATEDTTAPTVTSVTVVDNKTLRIKFSEDVDSAYATNISNYKVKKSDGTDITGQFTATKIANDTYQLASNAALTSTGYSLTIKNIVDLAETPNVMANYTTTFDGVDDQAPTAVEAVTAESGATPHKVAVFFSEKMNTTAMTTSSNFKYEGGDNKEHSIPSGTTFSASDDQKSVTITFPSSYTINSGSGSQYEVKNIRVSNLTDVAGNLLDGVTWVSGSIKVYGTGTASQPTIKADTFNLYDDSSTKIRAEFDLNQTLASLAIADFKVANQAPVSGYESGSHIVLYFDDSLVAGTVAAIRTASYNAALTTIAAPTASYNAAGTKLAASQSETVYDDQVAPRLQSVAMAPGSTTLVDVTFSEEMSNASLGSIPADFSVTSGGTVDTVDSAAITGAGKNVVELTLHKALTQNALVKVIGSAGLTDTDNDQAGTTTAYTPSSDDKSGYTAGNLAFGSLANTTAGVAPTAGTAEVNTITITGAAAGAGNSEVVFNDGAINKIVTVALLAGDNTTALVAAKVAAALTADAAIGGVAGAYTVANPVGAPATVTITNKVAAANVPVSLTVVPDTAGATGTAAQTTPGVAPTAGTAQVATYSVTGVSGSAGNVTLNFNDGTINQNVVVAVAANSTTSAVATSIAAALNANAQFSGAGGYTAVAATNTVTITAKAAATNKTIVITLN